MKRTGLWVGAPVVAFLREPKEKIWGLLVSLNAAGVVMRGLDVAVFDDWMRQEARRDEGQIGPSTLFYPMGRLERLELDETIGSIEGFADRFAREVGRPAEKALFAMVRRRRR